MQMLLGERDSKIAEMDAAATGEAVRLGAALEEAKGELIQLRDKHVRLRHLSITSYFSLY